MEKAFVEFPTIGKRIIFLGIDGNVAFFNKANY